MIKKHDYRRENTSIGLFSATFLILLMFYLTPIMATSYNDYFTIDVNYPTSTIDFSSIGDLLNLSVSVYNITYVENDTTADALFVNVSGVSFFDTPEQCYDGDFGTYGGLTTVGVAGAGAADFVYVYENYTVPQTTIAANVTFKFSIMNENACLSSFTYSCYNGASWTEIDTYSGSNENAQTYNREVPSSCLNTKLRLRATMQVQDPTGSPSCDGDDDMRSRYFEGKVIWFNNTVDSCWYDYNGTNITHQCNQDTNFTLGTKQNLTYYSNDSTGGLVSELVSWESKIIQNSESYNNQTSEGATETFSINFTKLSSLQVSTVSLIYNGTSYSFPYSVSGDDVFAESSIIIPTIDSDTNFTFYWNITLDDGSSISSNSNNQSVSDLNIDDCSSYGNLIYNFTMFDEASQTKLGNDTNIEIQVNIYDSSKTILVINFSKEYENINPAQICLEDPLLESVNYSSYVVVKYLANVSSIQYSTEYYNILNGVLTNSTAPESISLFDLIEDDATPFKLTFRDSYYALAPNILVQVWRQYISDNDFKIVEAPLTDSNGQTILNLVRNNVVYNLIMVNESGDVVGTFNNVKVFCQDFTIGDCTINLAPEPASDSAYDYEEEFDVSFTEPSYSNSTKLVSISFITGDLNAANIRMEIIRNNDFGNRSVCSDSLTAASGALSCNVSTITSTDQFLFILIYVDGDLAKQQTINLNADTLSFGTTEGAFFAFMLILMLICMFSDDKKTLVISLGIGWLLSIGLGLINGKFVGAASAGIWLIIIIAIFIWKLNKEDSSP